jgi:putative transposase
MVNAAGSGTYGHPEFLLVAAARYLALNPVRARLAARAEDWPWSSARAHLAGRDDALVRVAPLLDRVGRFADLVETDSDRQAFAALRAAETTAARWARQRS